MKLGDFKDALRKAPEVKVKEWKRALPAESMNCPDCLGSGKSEVLAKGATPFNCATCGGSGLQLSGAPKKKRGEKTKLVGEVKKAFERGMIKVPPGTKVSLEGPIKGRTATIMIMDDPIMERGESDAAIGVLSAFKKRHEELESDPKKRSEAGIATTDFLEDLFGTEDRRPATTRCTGCGEEVRRYQPDDHHNDCLLVKVKKCRVCAAEMGLCFKDKSDRAWICKPCARAKYHSRRR